jgi:proline iminopeptidase
MTVPLLWLGACASPGTPRGLENGSFHAELNGFDIHYEVHGRGPVLMVLSQSWGLSLEGLRALYRPLEEKLTLVYFDPRGMGESSEIVEQSDMGMAAVRADFQALREHLGLESVNAIGWSNGAMNLIYLASEHPRTIDAAIFVHGSASFTQDDYLELNAEQPEMIQSWTQFATDVQDPSLSNAERTAMMRALWLGDWFPRACADPDGAPAMFERLFGEAEFDWSYAEYSNLENSPFDARAQLPLIRARCLVIAGAHDTLKEKKSREIHDGVPDSQFLLLEGSGHFAPAEEPEAFRKAVFEFLGVE